MVLDRPTVRSRSRLVVALVTVTLVLAAAALVAWRTLERGTDFSEAVALAPAGTERVGWTDWAAVRDGDEPGSAADLDRMLEAAYDSDLDAASALVTSAETLRDRFEVSPANLDWELFTQSAEGAALLLRLPEGYSFDDLGDRLASLGFTRPHSETGVWRGGADVVATIGALTPQLQHWVLLEDDGLVVTSDTPEYAAAAAAAARGEGERVQGLEDVVDATGAPVSALVYAAAYACERLAMAQADGRDQDQAAELVRAAGGVNPLTGFALSTQPDGDVRVVMSFETEDQARANADSRAILAAGPAPGQGGDFTDRFSVSSATAEGRVVVLALQPVDGVSVVSDLGAGPVLFATC
ncbi:hypothetical protein [Nocardioides bigeumensis]|uniref:DUF3352 domain-containing protein n=1 Tax=Nocardioides bigeumensis TaxID=433657 RepID=A0ABN2YFT9_9ACTN